MITSEMFMGVMLGGFTICFTIMGLLWNKIDQDIREQVKRTDKLASEQAARTDKLYQMFIDMLKDRK